MKNLLNSEQFNNFNSDQKINLYFGLGKAYDDLHDVENSFKYLEKANLLKQIKIIIILIMTKSY